MRNDRPMVFLKVETPHGTSAWVRISAITMVEDISDQNGGKPACRIVYDTGQVSYAGISDDEFMARVHEAAARLADAGVQVEGIG